MSQPHLKLAALATENVSLKKERDDLQEDRIACELLVRAEQVIRCSCIGYATAAQRNWLIDCIDAILEKLDISV